MDRENTRKVAVEDLPEPAPMIDDTAARASALREKLADAETPDYQAELDPEEAERAGAFRESALNEADAAESADDLPAALVGLGASLR